MAYQFRGGGAKRARMISCARVARPPALAPRNNKYVQYLRTNYGWREDGGEPGAAMSTGGR